MDKYSRRPLFYNRAHEPIDALAADELLDDIQARSVEHTTLGTMTVSTVFLVVDHGRHDPYRPPVLYETMVFDQDGGVLDDYTERYFTAEAALAGHDQIVTELQHQYIL